MKTKKKYKSWFKEVCVGVQKIRNVSGTAVITIPKIILREHDITIGTDALVVLLIRNRKLVGELEEEEVWVKMNKKDAIRFEFFCEQDDELNSTEISKSSE